MLTFEKLVTWQVLDTDWHDGDLMIPVLGGDEGEAQDGDERWWTPPCEEAVEPQAGSTRGRVCGCISVNVCVTHMHSCEFALTWMSSRSCFRCHLIRCSSSVSPLLSSVGSGERRPCGHCLTHCPPLTPQLQPHQLALRALFPPETHDSLALFTIAWALMPPPPRGLP